MIIEDAILEKSPSIGRIFLSLELSNMNGVDAFLDNFKAGEYEIKRIQGKRSLNANAFMWKLCDEISFALGGNTSKEEVYKNAIRNVGGYYPLEMGEEVAISFCKKWAENGTGWIADIVDWAEDPTKKIVHAYSGSSTYDKKQMQRLLDFLVADAKELDLEIAKDERIESLLVDWEPKYV